MPVATPEKLVIVATHGGENPEKATIPFVVGGAALAMETKVTVILQSQGVTLAAQGLYEQVHAPGFDPVKKLVDTFLELGGRSSYVSPVSRHATSRPRRSPTERRW